MRDCLKPDHPFRYQAYDPGIKDYSGDPVPAQMVCCLNVLETVELRELGDVLDHLEELTEEILFLAVASEHSLEWWLRMLFGRFALQTVQVTGQGEFFIVANNAGLDIAA